MSDYIILGIIIVIIAAAIIYVIKQKKSGAKCIGCPHGSKCSSCGCGCNEKQSKENKTV